MLKIRVAIANSLSIPEIIIIWAVEKLLDFVFERVVKRARRFLLKPARRDFLDWLQYILHVFSFPTVQFNLESAKNITDPMRSFVFEDFLITHRRIHRLGFRRIGETCAICQYISRKRTLFENFNSDPRLYPPYKLTEGGHVARRFAWDSGSPFPAR